MIKLSLPEACSPAPQIKQQEIAARRTIASNPVQMDAIRKQVESAQGRGGGQPRRQRRPRRRSRKEAKRADKAQRKAKKHQQGGVCVSIFPTSPCACTLTLGSAAAGACQTSGGPSSEGDLRDRRDCGLARACLLQQTACNEHIHVSLCAGSRCLQRWSRGWAQRARSPGTRLLTLKSESTLLSMSCPSPYPVSSSIHFQLDTYEPDQKLM